MLTGIYDNLNINDYHADEAIGATGINLILDCPRRYYYEYRVKQTELNEKELAKQEEKYKLGRAVHMLVLEPEKFNNTFYCMTESVNLATKVGKEIYAQTEIAANGRTILRAGEWENIKAMADIASGHSIWAGLEKGKVEQSIFWEDGLYNTPLKARPDVFNNTLIVDIKTTDSIKTFSRSIHLYGYHIQAAMQIDALKQLDGKERFFSFFVIERHPPFLTACYALNKESIAQGRQEYLDAAILYSECIKQRNWPGYGDKFQLISLPKYALTNINKEENLPCLTQ